MMNETQKDQLDLIDGNEFVYNEQNVIIKGTAIISNGKLVGGITSGNIGKLWKAFLKQEYGTDDFNEIAAMEGF